MRAQDFEWFLQEKVCSGVETGEIFDDRILAWEALLYLSSIVKNL